jgi:hypothetical protein
MFAAIGYGLMVGIINAGLLGIVCIWHPLEPEFILGASLGVGVGNAIMYGLGFLGH